DTLPIPVGTVWEAGGQVIVANQRGEFAERTSAGWRQMRSGRQVSIMKLFGSDRGRITGIGTFAGDPTHPDSLIGLVGSFWQSYDPRPSPDQYWVYQDGAGLEDSSTVVVGYAGIQTDSQRAL